MTWPTPGGDFQVWATKLIATIKQTLDDDGNIKDGVKNDLVSEVASQVSVMEELKGSQGDPGPQGERGLQGIPGADGAGAEEFASITSDVADLESRVDVSLNPDGTLKDAAVAATATVQDLGSRMDVEHNDDGTLKYRTQNRRGLVAPNPGPSRLGGFPGTMSSPPTLTIGSSNGGSVITGSVLHEANDSRIRVLGAPSPQWTGWYHTVGTIQTGRLPFRVDFTYDGAELEINMRGGGHNSSYRILVDGEYVSASWSADLTSDLTSYLLHIDFTTRAQRHIVIEFNTHSQFGGVRREPDATVYPPYIPDGPRVIFIGDSWTQGANADEWGDGFPYKVGHLLGWTDVWASGIGGTGYIRDAGYATYGDRVDSDVLAHDPEVVVVSGGTNDVIASATAAQIEAAARSLFDDIKNHDTAPSLIVIRPFFSTGSPSAGILAVDEGVAAAADSYADFILDPIGENWITGTGSVGATTGVGNADYYITNYHPTGDGHKYLAYRIAAGLIAQIEA